MNILMIVHCREFIDDITQCKEFNTVMGYHLKHALEKNGANVKAISGEPWLGIKKKVKSTWDSFDQTFDKFLLAEYEHVLFVGTVPLKIANGAIVDYFKKNVRGVFGETRERAEGLHGDLLFYLMPYEETEGYVYLGPMINTDFLYPEKQYDKLVIHVDHHYHGRGDCSIQIKNLLDQLEANKYYQEHWNGYELYYHSKKLNSINDFDFYDVPPNVPFSELSSIYRKTHIGFISHRETLGMYHIEIAAAGGLVVNGINKMLPTSMVELVNYQDHCEDFWNTILPKITEDNIRLNSEKVQHLSYDQGAKTIIQQFKGYK
jgi:hypothetical protein